MWCTLSLSFKYSSHSLSIWVDPEAWLVVINIITSPWILCYKYYLAVVLKQLNLTTVINSPSVCGRKERACHRTLAPLNFVPRSWMSTFLWQTEAAITGDKVSPLSNNNEHTLHHVFTFSLRNIVTYVTTPFGISVWHSQLNPNQLLLFTSWIWMCNIITMWRLWYHWCL